jgi:hypothetical protein
LVGNPNDKKSEWTLVDTGLENSADFILQAVEAESKMIGLLNERLTEIGEKIRYKQKLEKDLLQIRELLAAERVKYANFKKLKYDERKSEIDTLEGKERDIIKQLESSW